MDYLSVVLVLLISLSLINTALHHSRFKRSKGKMNWKNFGYLDRFKRLSSPFSPYIVDNPEKPYMENVTHYPLKELREVLIKEGEKHKDFFGNETIPVRRRFPTKYLTGPMNGRRHFHIQNTEVQLCPSLTQIIFPKVAVNKDGQWKYIVNLGDDYTQGVRVETCRHTHSCTFNDAFPSGYKTSCEQRFVYKRLLSVTDKGSTIVDEFKMPSCCMCVIKKSHLF